MSFFEEILSIINNLASEFMQNVKDNFGEIILREVIQIMISIIQSLNEYEHNEFRAFMNEYEMQLNEIRSLEPIC